LVIKYHLFLDPEDDPISFVAVIISDRFREEELSISATAASSLTIIDQQNGLSVLSIPPAPAVVFENALQTLGYETSLLSM